MIVVLMQTNIRETREFLPSLASNLLNLNLLLTVLVSIAVIASISYTLKRGHAKSSMMVVYPLVIAGGLAVSTYYIFRPSGKTFLFPTLRLAKGIIDVHRENKIFEDLLRKKRTLPDADKVVSAHLADNIIFVIGESASRRHHSIYGYKIATTPVLDAMSDSFIVFSNAISCSIGTGYVMETFLTLKTDRDSTVNWYESPLLVDLMNVAGYRTSWISNQEKTGLFSNASGVMTSNASEIHYIGAESSEDGNTTRYDEEVLPWFSKSLSKASRNFIGIHFLGSHVNYSHRYPFCRTKISADKILNATPRPWLDKSKASTVADYDNSILYTDSILGVMIRQTAAEKRPSILLYVGDHGENVYDTRDFLGRDTDFVDVPFIVYANKAYRDKNPHIMESLHRASDLPISTSTITYALLTLTGTSYPRYVASDDFLSPHFRVRPRYVDGKVYSRDLKVNILR